MSTRTIAIDDEFVERPGPGLAPTAFRIWRAGANPDDCGTSFFTPRSAAKLMAEQEARGRVYSFDFNHQSIVGGSSSVRLAGAAGWHVLEVRTDADGEPELWAAECDWCTDAKAGLEADPPHWRFFSPAFDVDSYGEIVSYTNCALCINPLTHGLPALAAHTVRRIAAARKTLPMDLKAALAVIDALLEKLDGEAKEQLQLLRDFLSSMIEASEGSTEESSDSSEGGDPELSAAGEDGDTDDDKLKAKRAKTNAADGDDELKSVLASALARIEELEKGTKGDRMQRLLAAHPSLSPTARKLLSSLPVAVAEKLVTEMATKGQAITARRNAAPAVGGPTGGAKSGGSTPEVERSVDKALGLRSATSGAPGFGFDKATGTHTFNAVTPREARRLAAASKEKI